MDDYVKNKDKYSLRYFKLDKKYSYISVSRLIIAVVFFLSLYLYVVKSDKVFLICTFLSFFVFLLFIKIHQRISLERLIVKNLLKINTDEILYLKNEGIPFSNGINYNDNSHPYSNDLDIFGEGSLFQHLNRTATYVGEKNLSSALLHKLANEKILLNQDAIKELSGMIDWRQLLQTFAKITNDNKVVYDKLLYWARIEKNIQSVFLTAVSYVSPFILIISLLSFFLTKNIVFGYTACAFFIFNMIALMTQLKAIKIEILGLDEIHETIKNYSSIIEIIENQKFESAKLRSLKNHLENDKVVVSKEIKNLSALSANMQNILNPIATIILNGLFLYHIHALKALLNWKKKYSSCIPIWLDVIGEFEMLNSFGNFSFNNPGFAFPRLNTDKRIILHDLGHPLIKEKSRIVNTVKFDENRFIILTGSNMSGKSTFLRTLGINMVLAGTGSSICSSVADIHPLEILASMRLSDSLNDSESYFFAEVKRLKYIMDRLDKNVCFILLDEILRGTNSDDKRSGTIAVIKKMIDKNALGIIATHDLEVCLTKDEYPHILMNKCFEVEILNDDLSFDYKLKEGVCQNKSATFIMEKMQII